MKVDKTPVSHITHCKFRQLAPNSPGVSSLLSLKWVLVGPGKFSSHSSEWLCQGKGKECTLQGLAWKEGRDGKDWAEKEERTGLGGRGHDSHELGNFTVASCLDHLQGSDMLKVDPRGDGLRTHTVKISSIFFRTS